MAGAAGMCRVAMVMVQRERCWIGYIEEKGGGKWW
jgi:hypothetical protein